MVLVISYQEGHRTKKVKKQCSVVITVILHCRVMYIYMSVLKNNGSIIDCFIGHNKVNVSFCLPKTTR